MTKTFDIAKIPKFDGYQIGLASVVYKLFDKKTSGGSAMLVRPEAFTTQKKYAVKNENISNKE